MQATNNPADIVTDKEIEDKGTLITITKDAEGNYIPSSMQLSFDDNNLNQILSQYKNFLDNTPKKVSTDYEANKLNTEMHYLLDQTKLRKRK